MVCKRCGSETREPWMDFCAGCYADLNPNKGRVGGRESAIAREACLNSAIAFLGLPDSVDSVDNKVTPKRVIGIAREFLEFVEEK